MTGFCNASWPAELFEAREEYDSDPWLRREFPTFEEYLRFYLESREAWRIRSLNPGPLN